LTRMAGSEDGPISAIFNIPSSNWIDGNDYVAIEPIRFNHVLAGLDIAFEDYTFVDFGSGKGRALLLASEFPFRRILGLEFSPELHQTAEENFRRYNSATQKCRDIQSLNVDFADYALPLEASVLFFFHPCRVRVLSGVAYVAPTQEQERLFASAGFLEKIFDSTEFRFCIYQARI
jgi:SAM-dependent methyltransferase